MNITKYNCVICHVPFDDSIHLPRILNKCNHIICSLCISKKLLSNKNNTFSCPKDNTIYSKIENIDYFQINKEILDQIKERKNDTSFNNNINMNESSKFDNILSEKISNHTQKSTKTKIDTITINDNSMINNTLLSAQINHQCYIKKIIKFGKKLKFTKNSQICSIHSLPLNIICVDDQQKICSQCSLNNIHLNHQIIQENKFMEYINELVKVYQEIENNINIYGDMSNINTEYILEKIETKISKIKNNVVKICEDLIENINVQCKQISKYLDLRKNELFNKYQFTNCDINNLRETTNNWVEITCNKLTQASSGNYEELNIESLKLLDNDKSKNIFSLIDSGKQLNERYNFINETKEIINKLNEFNVKGLNIEPNYNIIDSIMAKTTINEGRKETKIYNNYNYNESIINTKGNNLTTLENNNGNKSIINLNSNANIFETSLFKLEENKDVSDSLNLTPLSCLYKQTKNIFITYENEDIDNFNDQYNTVTNIPILLSPKFKQYNTSKNNLNKINIYSKKTINSTRDYNAQKNEYFITFRKDRMSKTRTNFYDSSNRINLLNFEEKEKSRQNRLALSGNIKHKTQSTIRERNIGISQSLKRMLYPKLEKVKTCDVVFLGANKRKKNNNSFILSDENNLNLNVKYNYQQNLHKSPMSPQLKSGYNLINQNIKTKNVYSPNKEDILITNKMNINKCQNNLNKRNKDKEYKPDNKSNKNKDKKYKTRYIRCVSCSSSLNKKDLQDISILFNLKDKDNIILANNDKKNKIKKTNKNKNKTKEIDIDKISDISDITANNNVSQYSHNLNKSCIKQNSTTYYNFRNNRKNTSKTRSINSSFVTKSQNELIKFLNTQLQKDIPMFNRINMRGSGVQLLCSYMEKNQKIKYKEMKLSGCNLNDDDFCLLVKSLVDNEIEIPILNLSYNKISDNSAKNIFEIIKKNKVLKNIYLYNNIFSKSFIDKIKNYNKDKDFEYVKIYI